MGKYAPPVTFGDWLKLQRKKLDLTQDELAQRAGCSVFALRKIESGERRPSKQLAEILATALEVPCDEREIFVRVARGERAVERLPAHHTSQAPWRDLRERSGLPLPSLPAPATRLVGRDEELAAIERIFKQPHCRLLTLTGPGGIGKTRLAMAYSDFKRAFFQGGVYYIPLASLESGMQMIPIIAEAVGFNFSGPAHLKEQLFHYLTHHITLPALLVVDNVEHLLEPTPSAGEEPDVTVLISELLQQLPQIKILATSRERLNLQGEWTFELHGLAVPQYEMIEEMANYSAVALFLQSACRAKTNFRITTEDQPAILRICQFVDGIPLAIELAAAWVGVLSCSEIADEIETNIDVLSTTMRDIPNRHRSIRAAFDHSWNLLQPEEQQVLQQLAAFRGGFYRDAAAKIAGATLNHLASLVSKSLIRKMENGRYDLHEVIRQYARIHLLQDPCAYETQDRHCLYYLALLRDREKALKSAEQQAAVRELLGEMENIRIAWAWAIENRYYAPLLQAVRCFGWLMETAWLIEEGNEQLNLLVKQIDLDQTPDANRLLVAALTAESLLYFRTGGFEQAKDRLERSLDLLNGMGHPSPFPDPYIYLGIIKFLETDLERARSLLLEGLSIARTLNDPWFEAYAVFNLGYLSSLEGDYDEGLQQMTAGIQIWRKIGDPRSISLGLNFRSPTQTKLGRYESAKASLEESIGLSESSGNLWGAGTAYRFLGLLYTTMQQYTEAQIYLQKSLNIFSGHITGWDVAFTTVYLAKSAFLEGDINGAMRIYKNALRAANDGKAVPLQLISILEIARILASTGTLEQALLYVVIVHAHPQLPLESREDCQELYSRLMNEAPAHTIADVEKKAASVSLQSIVEELIAGA